MFKHYKHAHNLRTTYIFGVPLFRRFRKVIGTSAGGGGDFVRYTYKFLNFTYYRTQSILEYSPKGSALRYIEQWERQFMDFLLKCEDPVQKLATLCRGLDEKSVEYLCRILSRLRHCYDNPNYCIVFTEQEQEVQQKLRNEFFPQIFKLKEDAFVYNGYFLPVWHFETSVFYHKHSIKEAFSKKTLQKMKQKDIIDAGGFIGDSAIIFEKEFTEKKVYTFEPTAKNFELLQKTLQLNHSQRIVPINQGLGSENAQLQMQYDTQYNGGASYVMKDSSIEGTESVAITTLDTFVEQNKLEIGFIKVDIEGFEQEFLKGARKTIESQKPAMLLSIYHNVSDFLILNQ